MSARAIGPNFPNELVAAGLAGVAVAWGGDGAIVRGASCTDAQWTAVLAVHAAHDPAKPDPVAAAAALLGGGLAIASTGTPALDGTYGCGSDDKTDIGGLQTAILTNAALFPGFFQDIDGRVVTMTAAQFTAIATAILGFIAAVAQAKAAALAGGAWSPPAATATIA